MVWLSVRRSREVSGARTLCTGNDVETVPGVSCPEYSREDTVGKCGRGNTKFRPISVGPPQPLPICVNRVHLSDR